MLDTPSAIFVITNCTALKRCRSAVAPSLSAVSGVPSLRFSTWIRTCEAATPKLPAVERYMGDSWNQALGAVDALKAHFCRTGFLVASAGFGLIPSDTPIPDYSATFAFGDPNSVSCTGAGNREWWDRLVANRQKLGEPGSLTNLALKNPKAIFLVSLSAVYLHALLCDLNGVRNVMSDPNRLIIVSSGAGKIPALGQSLLPLDARFEHLVGGARATLNNRLLKYIAQHFTPDQLRAEVLSAALSKKDETLAPARSFDRERSTDESLLTRIRTDLERSPRHSASSLLRVYRDAGLACERKRFARLFALSSTAIYS